MKLGSIRTPLTIVLAIGSVALAAILYARRIVSTQNALDLAFFSWLILDLCYAGKWRQFKRTGNRSIGQIYDAHRTGEVAPIKLWLSGALTFGCIVLATAMIGHHFI
jgi:hypothetical protein